MTLTPSLLELLRAATQASREEMCGPIPGHVESYNPAIGLADIRPAIRFPVDTDKGAVAWEELPVIPSCQVLWIGGGSWSLTGPLAKGDSGLLLVLTYSIAKWFETGQLSSPGDVRHMHPANAVFLAGLRPRSLIPPEAQDPAVVLEAPAIKLGGGATLHAALAERVESRLSVIEAYLLALEINVGTGLPVEPFAADTSVVAATKVKVE